MKIAICSVMYDAYSETFIQAHKQLLKGEILFYNSEWVPTRLETKSLFPHKYWFFRHLIDGLKYIGLSKFSSAEIGFFRSLKKKEPDVVLAEYAVCGAEILEVVRALQIPLVIHCHGFDVSRYKIVEKYKDRYIEAFEYASSVIGVSSKMCQMLEELGCPKEKIVYTCYGPNADFLNLVPDYSGGYALAVGRFVEKKSPLLTLKAFAKVIKVHPDAKLEFVGDGDLLDKSKRLAVELNIDHAVTFNGSVDAASVKMKMQSALFFVQHSVRSSDGDMEGTPVAILEAQAAGLPVVSTRHAGIPDVVIENVTGYLVEELDVEGMIQAMLKLFGNKDQCIQMGAEARKRIKSHFTIENHISTLQKVLELNA